MPKGFFFEEEELEATRPKKTIKAKKAAVIPPKNLCGRCKLYRRCHTPRMKWTGEGRLRILMIGEAPGREEDEEGTQFIGDAGQVLQKHVRRLGYHFEKDFFKDNALQCRPPKNKTPTDKEIQCCKAHIFETIRELKPKKIFLLGSVAIKSVIGHKFSVGRMSRWPGHKIPDQDLKIWLYPMWHPSFVMRTKKFSKALDRIFANQMREAIEHDALWPQAEIKVEAITEEKKAMEAINRVMETKGPAFVDYETTGIKPWIKGHRILSMAISTGIDSAIAFPMFGSDRFRRRVKRFLTNKKIQRGAHSMKFEELWTRGYLGYPTTGWYRDTQLMAHCLDNRRDATHLKFQVYTRYGIAGYDNAVDPFKKGKTKGANAFNRMDEVPISDLLEYNGEDSGWTHRIAFDQEKETDDFIMQGYNILHDVVEAITDSEELGLPVDLTYYKDQYFKLGKQKEKVTKKIYESKETKKWRRHTGKGFNPASDQQVRGLLFNVLDYEPAKLTGRSENASVDQSVLTEIGTPFTLAILSYRKLTKLMGYLEQFMREGPDETMHPNFNFHIPATFRGSCNNPNFQNVPEHDEEGKKVTRSGIIPPPGALILTADYSGVEVRVSTCYHKDPEMIRYIKDPSSDMHRDEGMEIFLLSEKRLPKRLRYLAKNDFVFAEFYGDYYANCAAQLWKDMRKEELSDGTPIREHLRNQGIKTYIEFEDHIREVERTFWEDKFPVYAEWKKKFWRDYQKNGFVEMFTGFRCIGNMKKNEVINTPIQGTAAHLMFKAVTRLNRIRKKEQWKSYIAGQIHDELVIFVYPNEKNHIKKIIRRVMCNEMEARNPWIIIPLDIEAEISEVDGNWYEMKEEKI